MRKKNVLLGRKQKDGYWLSNASNQEIPSEIVSMIDASFENFQSVFGPVKDITGQLGLEIVYDPDNAFRWFEAGSNRSVYSFGERRIYVSTRGAQVSLIHELGHLFDVEGGPDCVIETEWAVDVFSRRSVFNWVKKRNAERKLFENQIRQMYCVLYSSLGAKAFERYLVAQIDTGLQRDINYIAEKYAQIIEKYAFLRLQQLDRPIIGVEEASIYSPALNSDYSADEFYQKFGDDILLSMQTRIGTVREQMKTDSQIELHMLRVFIANRGDISAIKNKFGDRVWWPGLERAKQYWADIA